MIVIYLLVILIFCFIFLKAMNIYKHNFKTKFDNQHLMEHYTFEIDFVNKNPTYYYADFTKCILNRNYKIINGIYTMYNNESKKYIKNICGICQYGIINYDLFLKTKSNEYLEKFKYNLDWIKNNVTYINNLPYWNYEYDLDEHKAPWSSGMSQGLVISLLVRGFVFFNDKTYLDLAILASKTLSRPIHEGGFKYNYDNFKCWFEESNTNNHILNGHIYALFGIFDIYRCTKSSEHYKLFTSGLNDIKENIKKFDLGFFSSYDAFSKEYANNSYHSIHIVQFEILYEISNDDFFKFISAKWKKINNNFKLKLYLFLIMFLNSLAHKLSMTINRSLIQS